MAKEVDLSSISLPQLDHLRNTLEEVSYLLLFVLCLFFIGSEYVNSIDGSAKNCSTEIDGI